MQTQDRIAKITEANEPLIRKIYNTVKHRICHYTDVKVFNGDLVMNNNTISVVMLACQCAKQMLFTLHQISKSAYKNVQVVLVDDSNDISINDSQLSSFPYRIDYIKINNKTRNWVNACVNYNIGFSYVKGTRIIIQKPDVFHIGDVISHVHNNLIVGNYLVYNVIASRSQALNAEIQALGADGLSYEQFGLFSANHKGFKWYQHSIKRPRNLHTLVAIHRTDFARMDSQFDYDFAMGRWYDDSEFIFRIQHVLHLNIIAIDDRDAKVMGCHMHRSSSHTNISDDANAIAINTFIHKRKVAHFMSTQRWLTHYQDNKLGVSFTNNPEIIMMTGGFGPEYANIGHYYKLSKTICNILETRGYKIAEMNRDAAYLDTNQFLSQYTPNKILLFNPFDFAYHYMKDLHNIIPVSQIVPFLRRINYIVIWQEVLTSDFQVRGYERPPSMKLLISEFFGNSKLNIVSNAESIESLRSFGIYQNTYSSIGGYSKSNGLVPLPNIETDKTVDVFIYGTLHYSYTYRSNMLSKLQELNQAKNNYNIQFSCNAHDEELDGCLCKTKMVVHIPSHAELEHMPWAKMAYLHVRKVFFIIESNKEACTDPNFAHIPCYQHGDVQDLYNKISYYLQNPYERNRIIEKNYEYITTHSNLDIIIPNLVKTI